MKHSNESWVFVLMAVIAIEGILLSPGHIGAPYATMLVYAAMALWRRR